MPQKPTRKDTIAAVKKVVYEVAKETGIDPTLLMSVGSHETKGKFDYPSSGGKNGNYIGTFQVNKNYYDEGEDTTDLRLNATKAALTLKAGLDYNKGDIKKAIVDYNYGMGNRKKLESQYGDKWEDYLPKETKSYIDYIPSKMKAQNWDTYEVPIPKYDLSIPTPKDLPLLTPELTPNSLS